MRLHFPDKANLVKPTPETNEAGRMSHRIEPDLRSSGSTPAPVVAGRAAASVFARDQFPNRALFHAASVFRDGAENRT
jgi:hypothetical protein